MESKIYDSSYLTRMRLIKLGISFGKTLAKIYPFIKLIAISGSLTNPKYREHNDIDFFIITNRGHVWDVFYFSLAFSRFYARLKNVDPKLFCFNYIIDESYVGEELKFDELSAYEFLNLIVIHGLDQYIKIIYLKEDQLNYYYPLKVRSKKTSIISRDLRKKEPKKLRILLSFPIYLVIIYISHLLKPLIKVREKRWRHILESLGYRPDKIYSNKFVYRRHKK